MNTEVIMYMLLGTSILCGLVTILVLLRCSGLEKEMHRMRKDMSESVNQSFSTFGEMVSANQKMMAENMDSRLFDLNNRFSHMAVENEQKLEAIRGTMEKKITDLTADNNRQLTEMRQTVDEKLQKTLEDRISQSFKLVSERLEQVYKGLGEMQNLAAGVGDLKKVLTNVKTRGILGEVQLGAILEQILAPDQYEENVRTRSTGSERVEFAVKLPGDGDGIVWLPIDAKFPGDAYAALVEAYESGDAAAIELAAKNLERVIKSEARDIRDKYVLSRLAWDLGVLDELEEKLN
jgi:DNA recombination protein RmuC